MPQETVWLLWGLALSVFLASLCLWVWVLLGLGEATAEHPQACGVQTRLHPCPGAAQAVRLLGAHAGEGRWGGRPGQALGSGRLVCRAGV